MKKWVSNYYHLQEILDKEYDNYCAKHEPDSTMFGEQINSQETCEKLADNLFSKDTSPSNGASIILYFKYLNL